MYITASLALVTSLSFGSYNKIRARQGLNVPRVRVDFKKKKKALYTLITGEPVALLFHPSAIRQRQPEV